MGKRLCQCGTQPIWNAKMSESPVPANTPNQSPPTSELNSFGRDARRDMIGLAELRTKRTLLCYVSLGEQISREDIVYMRELLQPLPLGTSVDLLLNSPGGDVDTAEKLVQMILQVTCPPSEPSGEFRLIVPDLAKSAATLVALGANSVVMGGSWDLLTRRSFYPITEGYSVGMPSVTTSKPTKMQQRTTEPTQRIRSSKPCSTSSIPCW